MPLSCLRNIGGPIARSPEEHELSSPPPTVTLSIKLRQPHVSQPLQQVSAALQSAHRNDFNQERVNASHKSPSMHFVHRKKPTTHGGFGGVALRCL